jgi:hypothetical protein
LTTCRDLRQSGRKYYANDFLREASSFGLETSSRSDFVLLDRGPGLLHLRLCVLTRLSDGCSSHLSSPRAAGFLGFEQGQPGIPQPLFILGSSGFGGGDISLCLLDRALGPSTAFTQNPRQRPVDQHRVQPIKKQEKNNGGDGAEQ